MFLSAHIKMRKTIFLSLTSIINVVKPRIYATMRYIYKKIFSAKDHIAFYEMLDFFSE